MGGLEDHGRKAGWALIGWIKEGTACISLRVSLDELIRYEERTPLDLRLGGDEASILAR